MKRIFEDIITSYGTKRGEFISKTLPRNTGWRELFTVSAPPKAEECISEEMEFYQIFEQELEDIPKLRNTIVTLEQWDEILCFLKLHNERFSAQIDNSTTLTATFVFMYSICLLIATYVGFPAYIIAAFTAFKSVQIFLQRMDKRHDLSRNKELVLIIENFVRKRRAFS